jgi:hypothetical protein
MQCYAWALTMATQGFYTVFFNLHTNASVTNADSMPLCLRTPIGRRRRLLSASPSASPTDAALGACAITGASSARLGADLLPLPTALPGNRNRNGNGSAAAEAEVGRRDPAMLAVSEPPVLGAYPLGVRPPPPPCATGCCFVCAPTGSGVGHPHLAGADRRWGAVRHGGGDHHAAHRQVRRPAQYRMQPATCDRRRATDHGAACRRA